MYLYLCASCGSFLEHDSRSDCVKYLEDACIYFYATGRCASCYVYEVLLHKIIDVEKYFSSSSFQLLLDDLSVPSVRVPHGMEVQGHQQKVAAPEVLGALQVSWPSLNSPSQT